MVNHWLLAQAGTGHGMIDRSDVRPSYHVFQLFRRFGSEQVYAESGVEVCQFTLRSVKTAR